MFFTQSLGAQKFSDEGEDAVLAAEIAEAMTDEELLAQVFMFGWGNRHSGSEPTPLILEWISKRGIGGIKVFGWNSEDLQKLGRAIGEFQKRSLSRRFEIPLLIATDQEGGFVRHVKGTSSVTPPPMAIGASGFPEDAFKAGYYIGKELALIGINMNFAPTVDLFINRKSLLISSRSFGGDPVKAGLLGAAFARGLAEVKIIPTAKHFPGHGATELDSHGVLPKIDANITTLRERELVPYKMLVKEGVPVIMSGHLAFPATEAGTTPASLSRYFLINILRGELNFDGVIVTDDLEMNAITSDGRTVSRAAKEALLAGNDIIMLSRTPALDAPIWNNLLADMKRESEFRKRVFEAALRVLRLKLRWLRGDGAVPYIPDSKRIADGIPDKEGAAFFQDLSARSVTIVKNGSGGEGIFPLTKEKAGKVLLVKGGHDKSLDFFEVGRLYYKDAPRCWYAPEFLPVFLDLAKTCDTVIFYLREKDEVEAINKLRPFGKKVIVLSASTPAYLEDVSWVDGAVAVYSDAYEPLVAGFSAICGKIKAQGVLP